MLLNFKIKEGIFEKGKGIYIRDEYSLEYSYNNPRQESLFLIYDTLTVSFESDSGLFISIDAFTNSINWNFVETIDLPKTQKSGSLIIDAGFEKTNRYSFKLVPYYEYSYCNKALKISLSKSINDDNSDEFAYISDNLIVGLKDSQINSFIIKNLEIL